MSKISSNTVKVVAGFKPNTVRVNRSLSIISNAKINAQISDPNKWRKPK